MIEVWCFPSFQSFHICFATDKYKVAYIWKWKERDILKNKINPEQPCFCRGEICRVHIDTTILQSACCVQALCRSKRFSFSLPKHFLSHILSSYHLQILIFIGILSDQHIIFYITLVERNRMGPHNVFTNKI